MKKLKSLTIKNMDINKAIERAKDPTPLTCPICNDELFAPMDKLSICLYGCCTIHDVVSGCKEDNLLTIINEAF